MQGQTFCQPGKAFADGIGKVKSQCEQDGNEREATRHPLQLGLAVTNKQVTYIGHADSDLSINRHRRQKKQYADAGWNQELRPIFFAGFLHQVSVPCLDSACHSARI